MENLKLDIFFDVFNFFSHYDVAAATASNKIQIILISSHFGIILEYLCRLTTEQGNAFYQIYIQKIFIYKSEK